MKRPTLAAAAARMMPGASPTPLPVGPEGVLAMALGISSDLERLTATARGAGDAEAELRALSHRMRLLELVARLTGVLGEKPTVQVSIVHDDDTVRRMAREVLEAK